MAPTDPNTAPRMRVKYTGPFGTHVQLLHGNLGTTAADLAGDIADYIDQVVAVQFNDVVWDTAEFADEGSPLFFPYGAWTPINGTSGENPGPGNGPSAFIQFGGRDSSSGTRVKLYVFETFVLPNDAMRIPSADSPQVAGVIDELNSVDNNIANIAGRTPIWYQYANLGENDYLTHKARR